MENLDVFLEKIVQKRLTPGQRVLRALGVLVTLCGALVALMIQYIGFILAVALLYGCYVFVTRFNVEYEYIVTNGELDLDKIVNRSARKRVLTVNCKNFEVFGRVNDAKQDVIANARSSVKTTVDATSGPGAQDVYFCVFTDKTLGRTLLLFQPSAKMRDNFRFYAPRIIQD